jgi:hypothetical protein
MLASASSNPQCTVPARLQGNLLKKVVDAIKDLVTDANFDCSSRWALKVALGNPQHWVCSSSVHVYGSSPSTAADYQQRLHQYMCMAVARLLWLIVSREFIPLLPLK